jgi:hypothetical protein
MVSPISSPSEFGSKVINPLHDTIKELHGTVQTLNKTIEDYAQTSNKQTNTILCLTKWIAVLTVVLVFGLGVQIYLAL